MKDRKARTERLGRRRREEKREGRTKRGVGREAKTRREGKRRLKEQGAAGAVAVRRKKDVTAAWRPHDRVTPQEEGATLETPFQANPQKDREREEEIKTETGTELEIDTERRIGTEEERKTGIGRESIVVPVAVEEMKEIEILALKRRTGKGKEENIQAAESMAYQRGPKEAGKRGKVIKTGSTRGNGDGMVVLLSHHLSKTSMGLTSLPSSVPSQSPPPQPPPLYPAPQDLPRHLPVGLHRNLTSPIRERRRENGTQVERWRIKEVVTADHSHSHRQGIKATSQTTILTNWRLTCCLWMVKLWIRTTHFWRIHPLLLCLQNHPSPAPKLKLPPRLHNITRKRNLTH